MDVRSEKAILKVLPNLTRLLIHCRKASGDLIGEAGLATTAATTGHGGQGESLVPPRTR